MGPEPLEQLVVAVAGGPARLGAEQPPEVIESGGDMDVFVGYRRQ